MNWKRFSDLKRQVGALSDLEAHVGLPGGKLRKEKKKVMVSPAYWQHVAGKKIITKKAEYKEKTVNSDIDVAFIGAVHEFGAPNAGIPERPWLRPGVRSGSAEMQRLNRVNLIKMLRGQLNPAVALRQLGAMAQGFVQKHIRSGDFTPLKPATIAAKGSSKPLIDTGQMVQSVTFEVRSKSDD
jgi:hypothetical protein